MFNPEDWPIAWMARTERQHARNASALLAQQGIHHREFRLMALLGQANGLPVGELAELAVLERPTVSKMIDRLVREGWVTRGEQADDRRRTPLSLTADGRRKLEAAAPIVEGLFRSYRSGVSDVEHARFVRELKNFFQRVQNARSDEPSTSLPRKATSTTSPGD